MDNNIINTNNPDAIKDFDLSLVKKVKTSDEALIYPVTFISFFMRMNFSNLDFLIITDENKNILKKVSFIHHYFLGKIQTSLAMQENEYIIFLKQYGSKNILRWQVNINDNSYAEILVCIDT